jgi:2-oxoglutarate ferredoxin oxidoreductase subunit beta
MIEVEMHDGSIVRLKKINRDHDPRSRMQALTLLEQAQSDQVFLTGLLYYEEPRQTLNETLHLVDAPLADVPVEKLRPSQDALSSLMASFA